MTVLRSVGIPPPSPARGGEGGSRSGVRVEGGDPSTTGVSSELKTENLIMLKNKKKEKYPKKNLFSC